MSNLLRTRLFIGFFILFVASIFYTPLVWVFAAGLFVAFVVSFLRISSSGDVSRYTTSSASVGSFAVPSMKKKPSGGGSAGDASSGEDESSQQPAQNIGLTVVMLLILAVFVLVVR